MLTCQDCGMTISGTAAFDDSITNLADSICLYCGGVLALHEEGDVYDRGSNFDGYNDPS